MASSVGGYIRKGRAYSKLSVVNMAIDSDLRTTDATTSTLATNSATSDSVSLASENALSPAELNYQERVVLEGTWSGDPPGSVRNSALDGWVRLMRIGTLVACNILTPAVFLNDNTVNNNTPGDLVFSQGVPSRFLPISDGNPVSVCN